MAGIANINVDLLRGFCEGGNLACKGGNNCVHRVNQATIQAKREGHVIVFLADCHPLKTKHFDRWQKHCIRGTEDQKFHNMLYVPDGSFIIFKGTGTEDDGYSGFDTRNVEVYIYTHSKMIALNISTLDNLLHALDVYENHIRGIATNFCDKFTAIDSARLGYRTKIFLRDCVTISFPPEHSDSEENAIKEMEAAGVEIVRSV